MTAKINIEFNEIKPRKDIYIDVELNQSPFHKIDGFKKSSERVSVRTDISPEDYELIEEYIMKRDPDFDPKKKNNKFDNSKFVRELLMDFFNNITLEKKSFEDMYFVMLLPKTKDYSEIEREGMIVGVIQDPESFITENWFNHFKGKRNKFNFIYNLEEFNERNYNDFLYVYHGDDPIFFEVDKSIQKDFEMVKTCLSEIYHDCIDINECYFTIFNINNYLDELNHGQYTHKKSKFHHEGLLVFTDALDDLRLCMTCQWSFYNGRCMLFLIIVNHDVFNEFKIEQTNNDELIKEYYSITTMMTREAGLERRIKSYDESIEQLQRMRDEKQALLDELRENNS